MKKKFGEDWLKWAVDIETSSNCDISAGLDLGQHTAEYIRDKENYINYDKLITFLSNELGEILSPEDLEAIASKTQDITRDRIRESRQSSKVA